MLSTGFVLDWKSLDRGSHMGPVLIENFIDAIEIIRWFVQLFTRYFPSMFTVLYTTQLLRFSTLSPTNLYLSKQFQVPIF